MWLSGPEVKDNMHLIEEDLGLDGQGQDEMWIYLALLDVEQYLRLVAEFQELYPEC
jgi:hypothetical protein